MAARLSLVQLVQVRVLVEELRINPPQNYNRMDIFVTVANLQALWTEVESIVNWLFSSGLLK